MVVINEEDMMDAKKMFALLGAMAVTAAAMPAIAAGADSSNKSNKEGVILFSGSHADGQNVTWHSSHSSHSSHASHSSHSSSRF